ncbi:ABC transporter permease subunit [Mycoplasma sp. CSL7491-lung]|uniref:ABC transporter permease subunit n=1 Tax=Mycoplasma sp. CSL7491-lung TaxID=549718 RepID=UPI001C1046D0|nr:ABC transporter permease subunit [Mycoplasma sp. CSL7491-lung]MBU4693183.1 ABC transporter permease subunit [Mycoplasma sp. CSL7491-lung]
MEDLKLYNWYGESFDNILPQSSGNMAAYKKQVRNIFLRTRDRIKSQESIDKDLYLRARTKLQDNLKRELASHKVAYKNKLAVLKDSIKKLSYADSTINLLQFEINKIKASLKDTKKYAKDFVYSLQQSADEIDVKLDNIEKLKTKTYVDEEELFKKFAIYNIMYIYIKKTGKTDFDIKLIHDDLLPIEQEWVKKLDNPNQYFTNIYNSVEKQRISLYNRKQELIRKYEGTYKLQKQLFIEETEEIKLVTKQKILELEYEYTKKSNELLERAKETKTKALAKIEEQKEIILNAETKNKAIVKEIIDNSNKQIKEIKSNYKEQLKLVKYRSMIQNTKDFMSFLSKNEIDIPQLDYTFKSTFTLDEAKEISNKLNGQLSDFLIENKENHFVQIAHSQFFSKINLFRTYYEFKNLLKSQYKEKVGLSKVKYTYEGKFNLEESKSLRDLFIDSRKTRLAFRKEKIKAKYELLVLKQKEVEKLNNRDNKNIDDLSFELLTDNEKFKLAKSKAIKQFKDEKAELKRKIASKEISKQAYKNKIYEYKINKKETIRETKLKSMLMSNKEILRTAFWREFSEVKVNKKIYESKITEAQKTIPVETMKNLRFLTSFLGFVFPGLSELLFFKQYVKGTLLTLLSTFIWTIIIPFSFGAYWSKMGGIPGFSDLGKGLHNSSLGIFTDARLYIFGGVISVVLLVFALAYLSVSSISSYRVAKQLEYGSRPSKWTHTKRWLNTSGFPWMISLFGWFLMIFIVATPIFTSILISFTNFGYEHQAPSQTVDWVGLKMWGYWWVFRENNLLLSLQRVIVWTIIWTILSTLIPISVGIIIAVLTNSQRIKFKKVFRVIYILPWAIPAFVTLTFIKSMFQGGDQGFINLIMLKIGLISDAKNWLAEIGTTRVLVIIVQTWIAYAWIFMLVTGNLQSIPKDIYEAGSVDGARGAQLFRYLTLPSLLLSIAPMLIGQFVGSFNNFTTISIFTGGGPAFANPTVFGEASTDIIISWVYKLTLGTVKFAGDQAFAAALTTLAALFSISLGARGFIKSMSRRD